MVQVHYGEGVATHTGPEPCGVTREVGGEASAGECIGQPLSLEMNMVLGAHPIPRLLGCYEDELQPLLARIVPGHVRVVDIGVAEGWYAVGLARRFGRPVLGFDIDPAARELTLAAAAANGVAGLVTVEGECDPVRLTALAGEKTLFIVDIEGAETALFTAAEPAALTVSDFLIETHGRSALAVHDRFAATHDVAVLWPDGRSTAAYPTLRRLQEIDRAIAVWEGRGTEPWLFCQSRTR